MICADILELLKAEPKIKQYLNVLHPTKIGISCKVCDSEAEQNARAYLSSYPLSVVLCSNRLRTQQAMQEALTHELVHAVDYVLNRYNFNTCDGLAFSEVRAARDAECDKHFYFEFSRNRCIKRTAVNSTKNLFPDGAQCVGRVFEEAMKDVFPIVSTDPTK